MNTLPTGSQSFQKRNPQLFGAKKVAEMWFVAPDGLKAVTPHKRLRQSTKPLLNKLEQEWFNILAMQHRRLYTHITFKLCNGLRYTPDMFSFEFPSQGEPDRPTAWEVKGKWVDGDSFPKLKVFAHQYPEIRVILVWKDKAGVWQTQRILP